MQELRSQNQFLKIISLKTHSSSFPGAQKASFSSLHFLRVCQRSTAVTAQDSISGEAEGRCPQQVPILPDTLMYKLYYPVYNGLLDSEGEGEGGMIWENGILTCILSCKN